MDVLSLRLFLRISDLGSVSAAAQDLSLSAASASARLAKLEENIGFRLFNRTTRAVTLTTDGAAFLPYAEQVVETLETGLSAVSGRGTEARGLLRMTLPASLGRMHILPSLPAFCGLHPYVSLDLRLSDEVLDVVEGAYDLIIRNALLTDSSMVARKLASDKRVLVASPGYIEARGTPFSPEDLKTHQCLVFANNSRWVFENGHSMSVPSSHIVNDGEAMRMMLEGGLGIGVKSLWNASESLKSGALVEVLPDYPLVTDSAIWAVYPSGRIVPPKVRVMIDFLLEQFSPCPPWER